MGITIWGWGSCGSAISIFGWGDYPCVGFIPTILATYITDENFECVTDRTGDICALDSDRTPNIFELEFSDRSIDVCDDELGTRDKC